MGFLTKEDFELLSQWGGKDYDKNNPEHQEAREELGKIYNTIKEIGESIKDIGKFEIKKNPIRQSGPGKFRFKEYNWGRFHPTADKRLCLTISMGMSKDYVVKIDINKNDNGLTKEQITAYERLRAENFARIVHQFDTSEVLGLDKPELINLTKTHLDELKQEWDWVHQEVFGSSDPPKKGAVEEKTAGNKSTLEPLPASLNTILYGPPGTGKTFRLMKDYFPLFTSTKQKTKEEFIKSELDNANLSWLHSIALAMLDFNEGVTVPELREHPVMKYKIKNSTSKNPGQMCWGHLQKHTPLECENVQHSSKGQEPAIFWKNGKEKNNTWKINRELTQDALPEVYELWEKINSYKEAEAEEVGDKRYEFVTFHQSFSYEDFIEGIKPNLDDDEGDSEEISYTIEPGVFFRLAKRAAANPNENYALFIDEINRGNISSIFGELITLIEDDKRAGGDNELEVMLPYSKKKFSVPQNLYIIGTMNTADRSVEALDSALRRRFSFIEIVPRPEKLNKDMEGIDLVRLLTTINKRLLVLIGKDNLIGHSYFMEVKNLSDLQHAFKNKIIPLLEEYFYHDRTKIGMVLGDAFVERLGAEKKVTFAPGFDSDNLLDDTEIYTIKDPSKAEPGDFIKIYSS